MLEKEVIKSQVEAWMQSWKLNYKENRRHHMSQTGVEFSYLIWYSKCWLDDFFFFFTQMDVHTCSLTYMPNTLHPHTNICSNSHRRVNNPGASKACTCTLLPWLHMVINDRWIQPHTSPSTSRLNNHEQSSIIKNNSIHYISHS